MLHFMIIKINCFADFIFRNRPGRAGKFAVFSPKPASVAHWPVLFSNGADGPGPNGAPERGGRITWEEIGQVMLQPIRARHFRK